MGQDRRIVAIAALVAAAVSFGVGVVTSVVLVDSTSGTLTANALRNCVSQAEARPQGNVRAYVQRSFLAIARLRATGAATAVRVTVPQDRIPRDASGPVRQRMIEAGVVKLAALQQDVDPEDPRSRGRVDAQAALLYSQLSELVKDLPPIDCLTQIKG